MTNGVAPTELSSVKQVRRHWRGRQPLYTVDFFDKTIVFGSGYLVPKDEKVLGELVEAGHLRKADPVPFETARETAALLQADLDMKPKAPEPRQGPELAPDFIQKNINRLLEIEAGHIVKPGPRLLRWLWPYVIVRE